MSLKINLIFFSLYIASFGEFVLANFFGIENSNSLIFLLVDILIFSIVLSFLKLGSRYTKYLVIILIISSITYLLNRETSLIFHLHGLREIIFPVSLFIIFERLFTANYKQGVIIRFKRFAYIFLTLQIPVSFIQFFQFGPGDFVGGTIGKGGSGILTFSIFILVYFLMELKSKSEIVENKVITLATLVPFFIPVALNETKITFLLILLFFLSLVKFKKIGSSILAFSLGLGLIIVFSNVYSTQEKQSFDNPLTAIYSEDFMVSYLAGDEEDYVDVPRITKLVLGSNYLYQSDKLVFGQSYSLFKEGKAYKSDFYRKFEWLLIGSRPYLFYLLFMGGLSLVLSFLILFIGEFKKLKELDVKRKSFNLFLMMILIVMFFYNDGLRFYVLCFSFIFSLFYSKLEYS